MDGGSNTSCSSSISSDYVSSSDSEDGDFICRIQASTAAPPTAAALPQQQQQQPKGFWAGLVSGGALSFSLTSATASAASPPPAEAAATTTAAATPAAATPAAAAPAATANRSSRAAAAKSAPSSSVELLSTLLRRSQLLQQKQQQLKVLQQQRLELEKQLEIQLSLAAAARRGSSRSSKRGAAAAAGAAQGLAVPGDKATATVGAAAAAARAAAALPDRPGDCCEEWMDDDQRRTKGSSSTSSSSTSSASSPSNNSSPSNIVNTTIISSRCSNSSACSSSSSSSKNRKELCNVELLLLDRLSCVCCLWRQQLQQLSKTLQSLLLRYRSSKERLQGAAAELEQQQQGVYCLRLRKLHEVARLLPIENTAAGRTILSLSLPPISSLLEELQEKAFKGEVLKAVSAAAGFAALLLLLISRLTATPLLHRIVARGARSSVCTPQGELPLYIREGDTQAAQQQLQQGLLLLLQAIDGVAAAREHPPKHFHDKDVLQRLEALLYNELWGFKATL
ncbi:hypothetical protein, conserved [Eimeria maxima]|uniref:Uncharacterized protein n=1 Tax=Eimeria maxima TaxID=5804 RepID=U6MCP7_EIMMA|nr:hypothetical protein, conserved [Eimeria maxima]CDJ60838.1 hypothetical protein, conserved [Eimeria maxima]